MRHLQVLILIVVLTGLNLTVAQAKSKNDATWPVTAFISEQSVLANYYRDYLNTNRLQMGTASSATQMRSFCELLLSSDLLADRLNMLGGKPTDMHATLIDLSKYSFDHPSHFSKEDHARVRALLLGLDMSLENIDHALATGTRSEFRREVLADTPPLNRVGALTPMPTPKTALNAIAFLLPQPIVNMNII